VRNAEELFEVVSDVANAQVKQSVLANLNEENDSKQEYNRIKNVWALLASEKEMPSYQLEQLYLNFQQKLNSRKQPFVLNIFLKYAAIFILILSIPSLYFYFKNENKPAQTANVFNTVVVTENSQRSKVILPDSSVVWLNAGTRVTYNSDFGQANRNVILVGQAFFQVTKNKNLPFIVTCKELKVKVLGTRFDVDAYPNNENINVALETGIVELLHAENDTFHYQLIPGELAQFNIYSKKVAVKKVNIDRVSAWTQGILYFNDSPMEEVLSKLERRFDIDIDVRNRKIYNSVFTGTIKNEPLEEIVKSIEYSCSVNLRIVRGVKTKVIIR